MRRYGRRSRSTYYKPRSVRKNESKTRKKLIWSLIISIALLFIILRYVLPALVGNLSYINKFKSNSTVTPISEGVKLAPPVLNIPYEATNTASIKVKGFATANAKVKIFLDDNLVSTITADQDGSFVTEPINLSVGTNNIYGKTMSEVGNDSLSSKTIQILYSNEKPMLQISEPPDGKEIKGGDKKVKVVGQTDVDNDLTINGTKIILNGDGHFSTDINLNDGENNLMVVATNSVGNFTTLQIKVTYTPQ